MTQFTTGYACIAALFVVTGVFTVARTPPPIEIVAANGRTAVANHWPVDALVFVASTTDRGFFEDAEVVKVPAGKTAPLSRVAGTHLRTFPAPLADVPAEANPQCKSMGFVDLERYARIRAATDETAGLHSSESAAASRELTTAEDSAKLTYETYVDETDVGRNNEPVLMPQRANAGSALAATTPSQQVAAQQAVIGSMLEMAAANASVVTTYLHQLDDEAHLLAAPAAQAKNARAEIASERRGYEVEASADALFWNDLAAWGLSMPATETSSRPIPVKAERACTAPPRVQEFFDVTFQTPLPSVAIAVAQVTFDKGRAHRTLLRRIGASAVWRGGVVWPVAATSARVEIESPWKIVVPGSMGVGRDSLDTIAKNIDSALAKVVKDYETAKARADGRDQVETVTIR